MGIHRLHIKTRCLTTQWNIPLPQRFFSCAFPTTPQSQRGPTSKTKTHISKLTTPQHTLKIISYLTIPHFKPNFVLLSPFMIPFHWPTGLSLWCKSRLMSHLIKILGDCNRIGGRVFIRYFTFGRDYSLIF